MSTHRKDGGKAMGPHENLELSPMNVGKDSHNVALKNNLNIKQK